MQSNNQWRFVVAAAGLAVLVATAAVAQTTTSTTTKPFEVVSVVGNQLVIKGPDGTREYTVPEAFRFTVDGKSLSVHDLKPGMKGEATVTTLTTSKPIQVVEQRNVKVMQAYGNSVILRAADGGFKLFTQEDADKYKVRILKDGKPIEFQQMHAGDMVSATFVTEKVQTLTEQQVNARLAANPPAPAPASSTAPPPAPARVTTPPPPPPPPATAAPAAPKKLPKTASPLPMLALAGGLFLAVGASLTLIRRRRAA